MRIPRGSVHELLSLEISGSVVLDRARGLYYRVSGLGWFGARVLSMYTVAVRARVSGVVLG